jgi:hypothetical protein
MRKPMTPEQTAKIEALRYAIFVCETLRNPNKPKDVNAAYIEIQLYLDAAINRINAGEDMTDYAVFQRGL